MIPIYKLLTFIELYPFIALLVLGFFGTEPLLLITFLAGSAHIDLSFWTIFIIGVLIMFIIDGIYYKIGNLDFIRHITPKKLKKKKYNAVFNYIKKTTHNNIFLILFISKFFYGFRQMSTIYFGYHRLPYKEFFKKDSSALFFYFLIMMPITWFLGKGARASFDNVKDAEIIIALAVFFIVITYVAGNIILSKMFRKQKRSN